MRFACLQRRGFTRFLARVAGWLAVVSGGLVASPAAALAQDAPPAGPYPVGMTQVEYLDPADGRSLNYMLIYPAAPVAAATPVKIFLSDNLHLYEDAPVAADGLKHPLVVFSHGAGGNGAGYAWFGEYLASRGNPTKVVVIPHITQFQAYAGPAFEADGTLAADWFAKYLK